MPSLMHGFVEITESNDRVSTYAMFTHNVRQYRFLNQEIVLKRTELALGSTLMAWLQRPGSPCAAKLDADAGVTDTNYSALWPAATTNLLP
jgi:hypothetical protein